jgi:flagellar L-ring protein FlgH
MSPVRVSAFVILAILAAPTPSAAQNLVQSGTFAALATDRQASQVGDSLTVLVYENATATNATQNNSRRNNRVTARASAGSNTGETAELSVNGAFEGLGQTARTGRMVAQISVTVSHVLSNGDLQVAGEQSLNINGEHTHIRLRGRVRRADIASNNTVLSSRLAMASIDYDGSGFVTRGARNSPVTRVFHFLGLI